MDQFTTHHIHAVFKPPPVPSSGSDKTVVAQDIECAEQYHQTCHTTDMGAHTDNSEDENDDVRHDMSDSCTDDHSKKTISNFSSLAQLGKHSN